MSQGRIIMDQSYGSIRFAHDPFWGGLSTEKTVHCVTGFFFFLQKPGNKFPVFSEIKKPPYSGFFSCGETGIRTQGTLLAYTHFPGVLLRPLGHLSKSNEE